MSWIQGGFNFVFMECCGIKQLDQKQTKKKLFVFCGHLSLLLGGLLGELLRFPLELLPLLPLPLPVPLVLVRRGAELLELRLQTGPVPGLRDEGLDPGRVHREQVLPSDPVRRKVDGVTLQTCAKNV